MEDLFRLDWEHVFGLQTSLLEIFLRGTVMYLALFLLLRMVLKRQSGAVGTNDLLVVVLLADAAQNAIADDYRTIPEGILLVGTILFWSYIIDWLGYRFPTFERLVHPSELLLVKDGKMLHRNMRREFITQDELMSKIRAQGLEDLSQVAKVYMEGDGQISVVSKDQQRHNPPDKKV